MQYSKYVNNSAIVRDETSVAQSLCFDDINSENFSQPDVTLFLSASLILPVAVAVPSVLIVFKYYTEIERKFINHKSRPSAIGTVITGICITMYMFCMDIAAVSMYGIRSHEYGNILAANEPISLRWSYATLIVECTVSVLAVFIIIAQNTCTSSIKQWIQCIFIFIDLIKSMLALLTIVPPHRCICLIKSLIIICISSLSILIISFILIFTQAVIIIGIYSTILGCLIFATQLLFFSTKSNLIMISSLVVPIIFVSAHLDYIFAAWLTEPAKTTSVAILALSTILFLFVMSRTSYSFIKSFMYKRFSTTYQKTLKKVNVLAFIGACIFTLAGVALVSLHIAAFFILPIPTVSLAIYLENVVQIFLVIFGALITYKIISIHESDSSNILKQLTLHNKLSLSTLNAPVTQDSETVSVLLSLKKEFSQYKIETFLDYMGQKAATIELEGGKIFVTLIGQENAVFIATSKIVLCVPSFSSNKTEVHIPLDKSKLEVTLADDKHTIVNISLKKANLKAGANKYPASEVELRLVLPHKDTVPGGTITLANSKILLDNENAIIKKIDFFTLPSYVIKTPQTHHCPGSCIRFDNSITFTGRDDEKKKYVLAGTTTIKISTSDQSNTFNFDREEIRLASPTTLIGYRITTFTYSKQKITYPSGGIVLQSMNENTITIGLRRIAETKQILEVYFDISPTTLQLHFSKISYCCSTMKIFKQNDSEPEERRAVWQFKNNKVTIEKKTNSNEVSFPISLNGKSIGNTKLNYITDKEKRIELCHLKEFSLNVSFKGSITFEKSGDKGKIKMEDSVITSPLPYDLIIEPNSIASCDTTFLYFPNPDQESVLEVLEGTQQ